MPNNRQHRYPKIFIRSKNDLAKRFITSNLAQAQALELINDVISNFNKYWRDSKHSQPEKNKYVRNAKCKPLGRLLKLTDKRLLAPHDVLIPGFIFGCVSGKSHIDAGYYLLGKQRERTLLALEIGRFFEQISENRVSHFFHNKGQCSKKAGILLASLCCVEEGPKGKGSNKRVLARGFATSTRLAAWCNLDIFLKLYWLVQKRLKNYDPRLAIFVDDIGISASRVPKETMQALAKEIENLLITSDQNQKLPVNPAKTFIYSYEQGIEHLGLNLGRNKLSFGSKTLSRKAQITNRLKTSTKKSEKRKLRIQRKSYFAYREQINRLNKGVHTLSPIGTK